MVLQKILPADIIQHIKYQSKFVDPCHILQKRGLDRKRMGEKYNLQIIRSKKSNLNAILKAPLLIGRE
jgi:hypothetical protein